MNNYIDKIKKFVNNFINKHALLKRLVSINDSYNNDDGNHKVAYITYYMFLSILPLLIAALTVLDIVFANRPNIRKQLIDSTLSSIPVIGTTLQSDLSFVKGQGLTLLVTLLILLVSVRGGSLALQDALTRILTKKDVDKSFISKQLRAYGCMGIISIGIVVPTAINGFVEKSFLLSLVVFLLSMAWNSGTIYLIFSILVDKKHARGYGTVFGGVAISIIQFLSVLLLNNTLDKSRPLYGTLAIFLALMFWISLQIKVLIYSAEINVTSKN